MVEVVCIGSATVDNFVSMNEKFSEFKKGVKILATSYEIHSGGGATNAAAALSKLGLKVGVITKLGDDHDADFILDELKNFKIRILNKIRSKHHTDNSTIVSSKKDKDRVILVHKEASSDLTNKDIQLKILKKAKWVYLGSVIGKSEKVMKGIMHSIKKNKINLLFNPSHYMANQGYKKLKPFLSASSIVILNKEEAQSMMKDKRSNITKLLVKISKLGPNKVLITNSKNKLHAYDANEKKFYSLVPPKVRIKDTAGAGDAFNSGFLAGIIKDYNMKVSIELGQVISSYVIQHRGTKNKLLNEIQAKRAIKRLKITCKNY